MSYQSTRLSDRFSNAKFDIANVERLSLSVGRRRSRGVSQGPSDGFPSATPTPRRTTVNIAKRLDLNPVSRQSPSGSSTSGDSAFSSPEPPPFPSALPDRAPTPRFVGSVVKPSPPSSSARTVLGDIDVTNADNLPADTRYDDLDWVDKSDSSAPLFAPEDNIL
jgi:hypothetical protein